ncbi:ATP-dependent DNA helicase UvrD/PcrA [Labilithrix luteola]|uniref:DNA 3'-5' helicase n=1 Tax=Labilithrix luteola TaxID=1391654 RepID=A0A0K1PSX9_9BACT|nr:UvrD-helicase domain-containing protein [Labilithrix luteola]AKU96481.1 ATP-dependent DNA helicase UvrD/PcrA [Labilithrix luteola]
MEMPDPELNPPQAEAVAHVEGPLLVFAGAGSGKTRVITYRIANLVARERVAPWRILAVTFTNKAAGEMRARLERPDMLGAVAKDLWVGTFHATCAKFLRLYPEAIERTKGFVIYDGTDQKAVVTRALRDLDLDEKRYAPKQVLGRIHKEKQEGRGPEEMSLDSYLDDAIKKAYVRYEQALKAANALDFEDLILGVVRILEADKSGQYPVEVLQAKEALEKKFDYILVDEFQDTNTIQYRLLQRLAARTRNLCVVGDDDQSIYRWRGADVRNIRGFRRDYADAKVVKLEQNYRSSKRIVSSALAIIASSATREPKELWTDNGDGSPVRVIATADERDEAACVVRAVKDARDAGISPREIAVFYRVHAQSRVLEEALRSVNIPYQIIGGAKFYERAEIKDAIAYLRVLVNPRSDVDMLRIINTPPRGIGNTTVERVATYASTQGFSIFQALERLDDFAEDVGSAPKKRLGQFRELMRGLINEAKNRPPADVLRMVLAKSGYKSVLDAEDSAEAEGRLENLAEFEGSMHDYATEAQARGEEPTLEGFLERVTLQSDTDNMSEQEKITLMTVHGAKGLEFELVLLTGMEEDMFPYRNQEPRNAEEMDEERRLAYVAVTRARKHLVITHARQRQIFGTTRLGVPSRFVGDLPPNVIEHLETPAARSAGSAGRWIDRGSSGGFGDHTAPTSSRPRTGGGASAPASSRSWQHPQRGAAATSEDGGGWGAGPSVHRKPAAPARQPGERFVELDEDAGGSHGNVRLRRGMPVTHERFGRGEVLQVVQSSDPAVVAFFPGWGEKKVLARFLRFG